MPGLPDVSVDVVVVDHHDSYTWNLVHLVAGVTGVLPAVVQHDEVSLAELAHRHGIVAPTGKPGTVILFDCNLMHGSNGNITPFPRTNAFLVYNAVSNRLGKPFGVDKPRPWFLADRGEPAPLAVESGPLIEAAPA